MSIAQDQDRHLQAGILEDRNDKILVLVQGAVTGHRRHQHGFQLDLIAAGLKTPQGHFDTIITKGQTVDFAKVNGALKDIIDVEIEN